jgi:glycosyltransferase involved in cell wall biosynthesis
MHENFPRQILHKEWISKLLRKILSYLLNQYLKRTLKKYDAVLGVSPNMKEFLEEYKLKEVKIIANYPLVEKFPIPRIDFETYSVRAKNFCYVGTINREWKNEYIIQATGELNFTLLLAGDCAQEYLENLKIHKQWGNVNFYGRILFNEVENIFNQSIGSLVLIDYVPNCNYKIGTLGINKLFENMKAGLPVICTDFVLWREIIDRYKCGIYVNPNDYEQIKNAIKYIIDHPREAYEMGQNGITAVETEFNWNRQREIYLEVYKKISESQK